MLVLAAMILGCGGAQDPVPGDAPSVGSLTGRICDADTYLPLADVEVYAHVVEDGDALDAPVAYTDPTGRWLFEDLPAERSYDLTVQSGSERLLENEFYGEWLDEGASLELSAIPCVDPSTLSILLAEGPEQAIAPILDSLELDFDRVLDLPSALTDAGLLSVYDVVIIEGGVTETDLVGVSEHSAMVEATLQAHVASGRSLLVTGTAYDFVEQAFPDRLTFAGDDATPDTAELGQSGLVNPSVTDGSLAEWLDADYVEVTFGSAGWPVIEGVADSVSVHLVANVDYESRDGDISLPSAPLLVSFISGEGRVLYSSFRVAPDAATEMPLIVQYLLHQL